MRFMLVFAVVALAAIGCRRSGNYIAIHKSARTSLPWAVQMEELFGDADHFITHFGFYGEDTHSWNTVVYFGGRYQLAMQVKVKVDYRREEVTPVEEPIFYLLETKSVELLPDGRALTSFSPGFIFGSEKWGKIYSSGGDFGTAGIKLLSTEVENFQEAVRQERRGRIPIHLLPTSPRNWEFQIEDSKLVREEKSSQKEIDE